MISGATSLADRAATTSAFNAVLSIRAIVTAFAMAALVQAGIVDVTLGLLLCVAISTIGVGLFWWASRRTSGAVPAERLPMQAAVTSESQPGAADAHLATDGVD